MSEVQFIQLSSKFLHNGFLSVMWLKDFFGSRIFYVKFGIFCIFLFYLLMFKVLLWISEFGIHDLCPNKDIILHQQALQAETCPKETITFTGYTKARITKQ